ncbi:methionyl-tRNA formyltransferase [Epilithonimonas sp. JDS]|uniref:methionyl-tRNA formyltransferase n=1 Tax=Epilithonimonas sp. JDS TaxID=2902797 RepID=UPI001E40A241|nr:methionyl-tRNA formyltransferase [Epilithonimonas sp. JDS]MCD9856264.1 methionyl-tRNA formyltransferase [Epilithonimonas sp. JDS]
MTKSLNVVFFGTPDFAKASLEAIFKSHHKVVGVVTAADKASGRGMKLTPSPVKVFAEENGLHLFQPEKLRNPEFLEAIQKLNADVFVVVAFRMMPQVLFSIPRLGTFNLHASLLPDYRGAAPINYAVINGETKTGVTTFFINEKIDEGSILLQAETDVLPEDNAGTLHDKLMNIGSELIIKTLDGLADNSIEEKPQPEKENPKTAYKIFKENLKIDWNRSAETVHNFVRGMSPYPTAFTILKVGDEEKSLKIFKGKFVIESHSREAGNFDISKTEFKFYTKDGIYYPEDVQIQGKKRLPVKDFLNGIQNFEDYKKS